MKIHIVCNEFIQKLVLFKNIKNYKMKNHINKLSISLSISILTGIMLLISCNITCIIGKGNITKKTRDISAFKAIDISGAFTVLLCQDSITSLNIEADENLHKYITTKIENNTLIIDSKESLCPSKEIKIFINAPTFNNIDISGAINVRSINKLTPTELKLDLSGASEINLDLETQNLNIDCSGASKLFLSGKAVNFKLECSGASEINAYDLLTENSNISSSGAGKAKLSVSKKLDVDISGAGTVLYKGTPVVNQEISGAGTVKKTD